MKALPVEPSNVPVAIGSRIRAARQSQRLTIEQVADATGLTKGFLSRVERDLTSPSVASLVTLCQVLSISIGDLFAAPETHLTKQNEGPRISLGGEGIVERLLTARSERRVQIIQAVIEPRGRGESELYAVDCDVDVLHVVKGSIRLILTNEEFELQHRGHRDLPRPGTPHLGQSHGRRRRGPLGAGPRREPLSGSRPGGSRPVVPSGPPSRRPGPQLCSASSTARSRRGHAVHPSRPGRSPRRPRPKEAIHLLGKMGRGDGVVLHDGLGSPSAPSGAPVSQQPTGRRAGSTDCGRRRRVAGTRQDLTSPTGPCQCAYGLSNRTVRVPEKTASADRTAGRWCRSRGARSQTAQCPAGRHKLLLRYAGLRVEPGVSQSGRTKTPRWAAGGTSGGQREISLRE